LNPAKRKEISQKIAERLRLSVETVDEIVLSYYKYVQKKLSNLEHERLVVDNLGTFYIKRKKLEEKLSHYKTVLEQYESKTTKEMSDFEDILSLRTEIKKFESMLQQIAKEDKLKKQKQEEKENYKKNKL
jgi:nucleoid DNA-binding protein